MLRVVDEGVWPPCESEDGAFANDDDDDDDDDDEVVVVAVEDSSADEAHQAERRRGWATRPEMAQSSPEVHRDARSPAAMRTPSQANVVDKAAHARIAAVAASV